MSDNTTSATWFRLQREGYADVIGPIQGNGGLLGPKGVATINGKRSCLDMITLLQEKVMDGESIGIFEPFFGHVRVYPRYSYMGNGAPVDVPIANCTISVVAWPGDQRPTPSSSATGVCHSLGCSVPCGRCAERVALGGAK